MEWIRRTIPLVGWVGLGLAPTVWLAFGPRVALGLVSGLAWALANILVLAWLIRQTVAPRRLRGWMLAGLWVLKVPVLYAIGAVLLLSPWSSPLGFLAGFSMWFLLLMISALRGSTA